jgi:hypothetical protein
LWLATLLMAAHLARQGFPGFRWTAWALIAVVVVLIIAGQLSERIWRNNLKRSLRKLIGSEEIALVERLVRALRLLQRTREEPDTGSQELADLHVNRLLHKIDVDRVRDRATLRARYFHGAALFFGACAVGAFITGPLQVVEGAGVMISRHQVSSLHISYVDTLHITVHPPEYLHEKDHQHFGWGTIQAPYGSLISLRVLPNFEGRRLVLVGQQTEIPFIEDGKGSMTARWPLKENVELRIGAKFGPVRIEGDESLKIRSLEDRAPIVEVDGAPQTLKLIEQQEIPVKYRAVDDHGLRQVDLVLRTGTREERRVLSQMDGDRKQDEGGYNLHSNDRFFLSTFLPIEVWVEAKDNDPLTGPKWGRSPALHLIPPTIGEPEARRYEALVKLRNRLVDLLAKLADPLPKTPKEQNQHYTKMVSEVSRVLSYLTSTMKQDYGGLTISSRFETFATAQAEKLNKAAKAIAKPGATTNDYQQLLKTTENVVLALDGGIESIAYRDARASARKLSKVALEAVDGYRMMVAQQAFERGKARKIAALAMIEPSGKAIRRLGRLGGDLGEIVANDVRRMRRAESKEDWVHALLVAQDLASRLSQPDPSFQGGGRGGGTEGGGNRSGNGSKPSQAEDEFNAGEDALKELARDHAGNISNVEQSLQNASNSDDLKDLLAEAKKHAAAIRESVKNLPKMGGDPDSPSSAAANAREQAQQMAEALERGAPKDAVEMGRAAEQSLKESRSKAQTSPDQLADSVGEAAKESASQLGPEVRWAEKALNEIRKRIQQKAKLDGVSGQEQSLADRAKKLAEQSKSNHGSLPKHSIDMLKEAEKNMQQAAKAFQAGQIDQGLAWQRNAQKHLEMARSPAKSQEGDSPSTPRETESSEGKRPLTGPAAIPKADAHKGPEAFRKRVLEGLSKHSHPRLGQAIKRYTEKLLR